MKLYSLAMSVKRSVLAQRGPSSSSAQTLSRLSLDNVTLPLGIRVLHSGCPSLLCKRQEPDLMFRVGNGTRLTSSGIQVHRRILSSGTNVKEAVGKFNDLRAKATPDPEYDAAHKQLYGENLPVNAFLGAGPVAMSMIAQLTQGAILRGYAPPPTYNIYKPI